MVVTIKGGNHCRIWKEKTSSYHILVVLPRRRMNSRNEAGFTYQPWISVAPWREVWRLRFYLEWAFLGMVPWLALHFPSHPKTAQPSKNPEAGIAHRECLAPAWVTRNGYGSWSTSWREWQPGRVGLQLSPMNQRRSHGLQGNPRDQERKHPLSAPAWPCASLGIHPRGLVSPRLCLCLLSNFWEQGSSPTATKFCRHLWGWDEAAGAGMPFPEILSTHCSTLSCSILSVLSPWKARECCY